jgi:N-hydroxyarylamine O-acetyltransferase
MINIESYLKRIDYRGPVSPTLEVLREIHRAHLLAVPFENLDIHLGRPLSLDEDALFDKIVTRRRGGFCFELCGLFAALCRGIGFEVTMLSARVARPDGGFGPDRDHLTLMIRAAEARGTPSPPQLADVGFGDSFLLPLRMDDAGEQIEGTRSFRIADEGPAKLLLRSEGGGEPEPQYLFALEPRAHGDFEAMCLYHQTSPESIFTRKRVCTRATPEGRITLSDMRFITTNRGERTERLLNTEEEKEAVLRDHFGVHLNRL